MRELKIEQGSHEWHKARAGIVTSTSLSRAVGKKKQDTLLFELVSARMTELQIDDLNVPAVVRAKELEPVAIRAAAKALSLNFEKTGFLLSTDLDGFGLSPDAVVRKEEKIVGGLEIKCPNSKKHIEYIIKDEIPKEYRHQVLAPFIVSDDIEYWYFMSFDDRNYQRPEYYFYLSRKDYVKEIAEIKTELGKFLDRVNEKHLELSF